MKRRAFLKQTATTAMGAALASGAAPALLLADDRSGTKNPIIGQGDHPASGEVGLTPRAKRVIELAIEESRTSNGQEIGTEHLLLGLVREGEGIAAGVLESLGITLDRTRAEVIRLRGAGDEPA